MTIPLHLEKEYVPLMREFIADDSIFQWASEGIQYHVFRCTSGWKFEWDKDGEHKSHYDSDWYFANAFYNGGILNGLRIDEWLSTINQPVCEQLDIGLLI